MREQHTALGWVRERITGFTQRFFTSEMIDFKELQFLRPGGFVGIDMSRSECQCSEAFFCASGSVPKISMVSDCWEMKPRVSIRLSDFFTDGHG